MHQNGDAGSVNVQGEDVKKLERAEEIVKQAHDHKNDWYVKDIESGEVKRSPKAPFITSTIQQVASTRLGFSPSRTMRAAQKLYENGHITIGLLSLTSSCYCQKNFREHRNDLLTSKFPKQYLYHGCGSCVKCMRINGGILAFTSNFTRDFAQHWFKQIEKYPQDETLNSLRPLVADKFERK